MNDEISCDVVLDLIPLVGDNIASEDSKYIVSSHIEKCENCREIYNSIANQEKINDSKVIGSIKKNLYLSGIVILIFGGLLGVFLSNEMGMFYNLLIMPALGGIGFFVIKKKKYLIPISIFIFSYIWLFVYNLFDNILWDGWNMLVFVAPLYLSGIYTLLTVFGIIIGWLLKFAFRKEKIV